MLMRWMDGWMEATLNSPLIVGLSNVIELMLILIMGVDLGHITC